MFSFGDAIIFAILIGFVVWVLKRVWPETFASELGQAMKREVLDTHPDIVTRHRRPARVFDIKTAVPAQDPLTGKEERHDYVEESNVGRAHVHEDGAFAGGLNRDKGG
jgi:hypothetical protein